MPSPSPITVRVRYGETDKMGVVYHANYFVWFEMARVELFRDLGFSYKEMEADNCHLPVVEATCRYRAPAHYDETLTVETRVALLRHSLFKFSYRLTRDTGDDLPPVLLAEAETTHILVDGEMKMRRLPERYVEALRDAALAEW